MNYRDLLYIDLRTLLFFFICDEKSRLIPVKCHIGDSCIEVCHVDLLFLILINGWLFSSLLDLTADTCLVVLLRVFLLCVPAWFEFVVSVFRYVDFYISGHSRLNFFVLFLIEGAAAHHYEWLWLVFTRWWFNIEQWAFELFLSIWCNSVAVSCIWSCRANTWLLYLLKDCSLSSCWKKTVIVKLLTAFLLRRGTLTDVLDSWLV